MIILLLFVAGLSCFGVSGRAVNISSAWLLPQEGFPVFYRYFSDKVTWNEAEAVCGFHHADLLSVQTSPQMDAARAYLKEMDVSDNVWIGLQKESPEKPFSWTNGEKLLGDGYWMEPIPKTNEKLCAAIDPVSDFRWSSFYCRGPQVASFVCELPVPEWAKKEDGCMVTNLPSLTITLVPEMGVIQLFSDCGLDGTRRIACKGGVNREEILRRLSCDLDASTIFSKSTTDSLTNSHQSTWPEANDKLNRVETTQTKSWDAYSPQTRHRRNANMSDPSTVPPTQGQQKEATSTAPPSTQGRAVLNVPYIFPHSPHSPSERNSPGKKKMKRPGGLVTTTKKPESTLPAVIKLAPTAEPSPDEATTTPKEQRMEEVPVLIITGEKLNESATSESGTPTSENPQIVLMIENKEDTEPYLVPLADDIILHNPSLSPLEVINVDLVEVDNVTSNSTTSGQPLKMEERKTSSNNTQTTSTAAKTTPQTEESLNVVDKEGMDVPQRPNRGRLLTHPNHPSFYPRFLNRVLG